MSEASFEKNFCKHLALYVEARKPYEKKGYISRLAKKLVSRRGNYQTLLLAENLAMKRGEGQ